MRMGAFLLGGLVGAAAVVYLSRNRNSMMFSSITGETFGKAINKMRSNFMNQNTGRSSKSKAASEDGLGQVKNMVEQDPQLSKQVNEIFADNAAH